MNGEYPFAADLTEPSGRAEETHEGSSNAVADTSAGRSGEKRIRVKKRLDDFEESFEMLDDDRPRKSSSRRQSTGKGGKTTGEIERSENSPAFSHHQNASDALQSENGVANVLNYSPVNGKKKKPAQKTSPAAKKKGTPKKVTVGENDVSLDTSMNDGEQEFSTSTCVPFSKVKRIVKADAEGTNKKLKIGNDVHFAITKSVVNYASIFFLEIIIQFIFFLAPLPREMRTVQESQLLSDSHFFLSAGLFPGLSK